MNSFIRPICESYAYELRVVEPILASLEEFQERDVVVYTVTPQRFQRGKELI